MHNLFLVTIFSISVTLLALNYSSNVILYNRAFNRVYANFERSISNKDYLNRIIDLIKNNNDDDIKQLFNLIKTVENENLTIEIKDISSKMDLNFIDFTIFKDEPFITLLKEEYN